MSCNSITYPPLEDPRGLTGGGYVGQRPDPWDLDDFNWGWTVQSIGPYVPSDPVDPATPVGDEPDFTGDLTYVKPDPPYVFGGGWINPPSYGKKPTLDAVDPGFSGAKQPDEFDGTHPGVVDDPTVIVISDITSLTPTPTSSLPTISDPADIGTIEFDADPFTGIRPDPLITVDPNNFSYVPEEYTETVLDDVATKILAMLSGGVVISEAAWLQMYNQHIERDEVSSVRAIEEATEGFASRGWSMPGGALNKTILDVQQKTLNARSEANRDLTIKRADMEMDTVKFAVAQGIAAEQIYKEIFIAVEDNKYKAEELEAKIALQFIEVKIALLNAQVALYQADASVYKTHIEAELARLSSFELKLKKESLDLEADTTRVQKYEAELKKLGLAIEAHNAQINTTKERIDYERLELEHFGTKIKTYVEEAKVYGIEWDGYKSAMQGEIAKVDYYKTQIQAYGAELDAYNSVIQGEKTRIESEAIIIQGYIDKMKGDVQRYSIEADAEIKRIGVVAEGFKQETEAYKASIAYYGERVRAYTADTQASITNNKASAEIGLANAQLIAGQLGAITKLHYSAQETIAKIEAQIEASSLGQFNAKTSMNYSSSQRFATDCSS